MSEFTHPSDGHSQPNEAATPPPANQAGYAQYSPLPPLVFDGTWSATGPLPEGLNSWNWGAFAFGYIWGCVHGVWMSLLTLVPGVNIVMMVVLGMKGNEWAWRARPQYSVADFMERQRPWQKFGLIMFCIQAAFFVLYLAVILIAVIAGIASSSTTS